MTSPDRATASAVCGRNVLLDVSRLVWRSWKGGLPTGIDRVCHAYVAKFGSRSLAVLQKGGVHLVFGSAASDRLFSLLKSGRRVSRVSLARCLAGACLTASLRPPRRDMMYLNVGHTGLHEPTLTEWIRTYGIKAVYLIHDLIPITHPEYCRSGEAEKHASRMRNALTSAAGIIGNSQATLDELASYAQSIGARMPVTIVSWISGHANTHIRAKRSSAEPYFVALGTIEGRKNHRLLIDVWRRLLDQEGIEVPGLVIVGQRGWQADDVFDTLDHPGTLNGRVRELNSCDDGELTDLLLGARALLMPSFAEGFGLPIIEAMQLGTPVVASDLPVFREIAGQIPMYADPTNLVAWETAVKRLMSDDGEAKRQRSLMENYVAPSWDAHFALVEPWLETLQAAEQKGRGYER